MEEEFEINYPYYETAYLDDDNNTHLVKIKDDNDLKFYKDRFTILEYNLVTA